MPDKKFEEKWQELQKFVPFLQRIINNLKRQMKDKPRAVQLEKMEMLHDLLTKRDKTKLKYETLVKCETLLNKIYSKVEKVPLKNPVVMSTDVVEILEPDSPPPNTENAYEYRPPIEIPTEREKSPELLVKPTNSNSNEPKIVISSDLSLEELIKRRELLENKLFNCTLSSNSNNSNSSNEIAVINESVIEPESSKRYNSINYDHFDIESISNSSPSALNKSMLSLISLPNANKSLQEKHEKTESPKIWQIRNDSYESSQRPISTIITDRQSSPIDWNDDFIKKQQCKSSPGDVKKIRDKKLEFWSKNEKYSETHNSKSKNVVQNPSDKLKQRRSSTPDWDAEIEEEERLKDEKNRLNKKLELSKGYGSPANIESYSNSRERGSENEKNRNKDKVRHHKHKSSRWDIENIDDRDKHHSKHRHSKFDSSLDKNKEGPTLLRTKLSPPPSLSHVTKYLDDIESAESCSLSPIDSSDSNLSTSRTVKILKGEDLKIQFQSDGKNKLDKQGISEDNLMKVHLTSAATSSVKALKGEDLKIQVQNEKFRPQKSKIVEESSKNSNTNTVSSPSIIDVLKSPPLSANDIDDLLHESGSENAGETTVTSKPDLSEVRKKLAKISTKLNQNNVINENKIHDFDLDSSDKDKEISNLDYKAIDRLALKYHPHVKKNSNNLNNEGDTIVSRSEKLSESFSKSLQNSNINNNISTIINSYPTVSPNDPRLKSKCQLQEGIQNINETYPNLNFNDLNKLQNVGNPIPTLLNQIVANPLTNLVQPNVKLTFPSNLIDIPLQVNIPLQTVAFQQQQLQQIPVVTIPKSAFSEFLNSNQNLLKNNTSNDQIGYNKINPIQNDNFERQKYLESKKSKEDCFTTHIAQAQNAQPKTYGEYRRQCEIEKSKVSKMSGSETSVESKDTKESSKNNQSNSVSVDDKDPKHINSVSKLPRQLSKRRDSLITKIETEKHSKISHTDSHINKVSSLHSTNIPHKISTSITSSETPSICKFKIPKKSKDDEMKDESKVDAKSIIKNKDVSKEETKTVVAKHKEIKKISEISQKKYEFISQDQSNIKLTSEFTDTKSKDSKKNRDGIISKIDDKTETNNKHEYVDHEINERNVITTSKKSKRKFIPLKSEESAISESKIQQRRKSMTASTAETNEMRENSSELKSEQVGKLTIRRKSMSAATSDKNLNFEIKSDLFELSTSLENEKNYKNSEIIVIKDDTESLQSFDTTTDSASVSSHHGGHSGKRSRRYNNFYYEVAPDPKDNTILSVDNIIEGKRRSRSLVNMNESSLAIPKYVPKKRPGNNDIEFCSSTEDVSNIAKEKSISKKSAKSKNTSSQISETECDISFESDSQKSSEIHLKKVTKEDERENKEETKASIASGSRSTTESNSGTVESLLSFLGPNSNKENLLEILAKVCDEKKFEKIKAILEEDEKLENKSEKEINLTKGKFENEPSQEDKLTDNRKKQEGLKTNVKPDRKLKHKTELDRLNEDIRDMFISQGVLSAFGKRNQIQSVKICEAANTNKKNTNSCKYLKKFRLREVKIILKKLKMNYIDSGKTEFKTKSLPKRRRGASWARGYIAKKKSAPSIIAAVRVNKATKKTGVAMLSSSTPKTEKDKNYLYSKPCPKSKKSIFKIDKSNDKTKINTEKLYGQRLEISFLKNNVVPSKNIYPEMHAKSEYCKKCLICHKINIQKLVLHHVESHPQFEVFISRIPPDTLKDLCSDRNNSALYQYLLKSRSTMFHYRCPFCDIQQTASRSAWLDHFSTHTGEFHYKCSGCNKQSNLKKSLLRHIKMNCENSQIITRESFTSSMIKNISGFICNICNYIQLSNGNIIKHLISQHSPKEKQNYRKIKLLNMENVPKLNSPPSEETKILEDENIEDIDDDDIETAKTENSKNVGDKLDVFIPKEQTDSALDKNLLNYMNEVITFSVQAPKITERTSKSIVDELSERLKSQNSSEKKKKEIAVQLEKDNNEIISKEKSMSIVDLLSQRFQNLSDSVATNNRDVNDKGTEGDKTPVVYILDKIDDDNLDNIELAESSEQVVLSINKPISNSRADILDKIGGSATAQLNLNENDRDITDSIYATLSEKLKNSKSPDKKVIKKDNLKRSQKESGIMIIDRLNKRLNEATHVAPVGTNKVNETSEKQKSATPQKAQKTSSTVDNEDRTTLDSSDDNLVIDEDYTTPSLSDINVSSENANGEAKDAVADQIVSQQNEVNTIEDDDDCWEDIEEIPQQSNENPSEQPKQKDNIILKTLSKIYVSFGKNKPKLKKKHMDTKKTDSAVPSLISNDNFDSNFKSNTKKLPTKQQQHQAMPLSDLISDSAIPSPISTELCINPPVPIPSEPLSDLNDISAILEPTPNLELLASAKNNSNINIMSTPGLSKVGVETSAVHTVNINDINEPIYVLPDNVTFADALVLAAKIENTKKINKKESENDNIQTNKLSKPPVTCRINNLGFSESDGKVKYFCLIKPCSFLFSDQEIGLQNHYFSDHKAICWDGYCYACEANICSEEELPLDRELKHMIEVHIKNLLKSNNLCIENNQSSDSSKSFEETLMTNRPKITIRRLSGDLLSKSKQQEPVQEHNQFQSTIRNIPISLISSTNSPLTINNSNTQTIARNTNVTTPNNIVDPKLNLAVSKQNVTIKDLLEIPSIPPPILPQLLADDQSNLTQGTTIPASSQRLQLKTYTRPSSNSNKNSSNIEKPSTCTLSSKANLTISPIQNNLNSGSGLKISSVSQGVTITDKEKSPVLIPPIQNNSEPIKIISVCSGVTNIQVETPKIPKISSNIKILPVSKCNEKSQPSPACPLNQHSQQLITPDTPLLIPKIGPKVPVQTQSLSKVSPGFLRIENVCSLNSQNPVIESIPIQQIGLNLRKSPINVENSLCSAIALSEPQSVVSMELDNTQVEKHSKDTNENLNSVSHVAEALTSSESSEILETTMKLIKPWIFPTVSKSYSVTQYQLRAISLYALFKCMSQDCFFTTNSVQNILDHFQFHEQNNNFDWLRCSYCNFTACNGAHYVEHIHSVHSNDIFQCPYCFYRSCNDFNVLKHIEEYHQEQKPLIFVCHGERKRLASEMKHLAIYRNRHIKPIPCFDCSKKFFILRNYLKHINEHGIISECYTCGICKANGLLKKCADTHLSLVHRISVYQCIYCDMSSSLRSAMVVHMAKEHPSHLLYSCVRVSPNKNTVFITETIENSTVLANLNENVNAKYLQSCNFSLENLNFMNPALDSQAIEQNKNIKISVNYANVSSPAGTSKVTPDSSVFNLQTVSPPLTGTIKITSENSVPNLQTALKITSVTSLAQPSPTSVIKPAEISAQALESVLVKSAPISSVQIQNAFASVPIEDPVSTTNQQENFQILSNSSKISKNSTILNKSHGANKNTSQTVGTVKTKSHSSTTNTIINETITIDDSDVEEEISSEKSENKASQSLSENFVASTNIATKNIKDILKNCTELTKSVALAQEKQEVNTKLVDLQSPSNKTKLKIFHQTQLNCIPSQESSTNNTIAPEPPTEDNDLNKQIIEAAKEYVLETGYEGSDLYRCALPECANIKLSSDTLSAHYSQVHQRLRQYKCPHCTCQYGNIRSLKQHLATHKRHRYFCFLCNHTTSVQQHLSKHMTELHSKTCLVSFPLTNQCELDAKEKRSNSLFFVVAPATTKQQEIVQFGERLIRTCERKRSLAKRLFSPNEIDQLPFQAIFNSEAFCSVCSYRTKVRTNMYRHLLFHKSEVEVASVDPVNPVPCLVSNEKNFDKMINMALSSNLNKDNQEKLQTSSSVGIVSSDTKGESTNEEIKEALKKGDLKIPEFIPLMRRFICGVPNCNYLTITDYMLKCHLQTLHSEEKQYKCPHCKIEILQKKNFCSDKILQHLKFHDSKVYLCGECYYMHFLKHVVERHINDRHAMAAQINVIQYERKDTNTIITKHPCGRLMGALSQANIKIVAGIDNSNNTNVDVNLDKNTDVTVLPENSGNLAVVSKHLGTEETKWSCTTCKFNTIDEPSMINHINSVHNIRFRYGCFDCKFGACQINLVKEHISDKHHNFQQRQVKSNYYRLDESDYDVVQENRPLWTRSDPYRIKHIRGILMEEEEVGHKNSKNEGKKSSKLKKLLIGNSNAAGENSIITTVVNKRKSLDRKPSEYSLIEADKIIDPTNVVILNDSSSSSQDSNTKTIPKATKAKQSSLHSTKKGLSTSARSSISSSRDSLEENLSVVIPNEASTSNIIGTTSPERTVEIYECYYCPTKNISFKVIYTHWLLHHCKKASEKSDKTADNVEKHEKTPLLAKPFAFKVVGYIGEDSVEVSTYDVTKNQLSRLLKMGQRVTRFQCNKCWRLFANSISVAEHQKHEHASSSMLNVHRCLTFKNRNFFICNSCGYASSLECKTAAHLLNHYDGLKKCNKCNQEFDKFLEFIRHLPKHNTTFKQFLENDKNIKEFWSKIIILFPNGLCMMRCHVPQDSKVILEYLLDIVNNEVEAALMQTASQISMVPKQNTDNLLLEPLKISMGKSNKNSTECSTTKALDKKSADDEKKNANYTPNNINNLNLIDRISLDSDDTNFNFENENSRNSISSISNGASLNKKQFNKNDKQDNFENILLTNRSKTIKSKRKYEKDSDWTPTSKKKRKIITDDLLDSLTSTTDEDDDDDNIPLSTVIRNTPPIRKLEKSIKPFIGPKFTQRKYHNALTPYSYYGNKPMPEDLDTIMTKIKFNYSDDYDSDSEPILLTCQQYAEIVPIDCHVIVEKLNPSILKLNTINLFKRKPEQKRSNDVSNSTVIEDSSDSNSSSIKKRKV